MKKAGLLFLSGALFFTACQKDPVLSKDAALDGVTVDVSAISTSAKKIFVLNEGGMGSNNATLDFLRFEDGKYISGAFKKMNPTVGGGLGDVGNDIAIHGDEVWMVINNSGLVEVVSAVDETEIATVTVPTPRNIAFDDKYAYVTSWAGAFVTYGADYSVTDSSNPKGQVYRINLNTKKVEGTVEVGYQPEGIACYDGKLYVANSGGISSQLPPTYSYDNTVSIIDTRSFAVTKTVEVEVNLKNVYSDGQGFIYVTSMGNYYDVHSGLYGFPANAPENVGHVWSELYKHTHVSCSCILGDEVYCIGTQNEFAFGEKHEYTVWSYSAQQGKVIFYPLQLTGVPYGVLALGHDLLLVADAGDYFNPGTLNLYEMSEQDKRWSVTTGVCPGHFAVWK